jgi:predicted RNA-binding protein with PIN domain
MSEASLYLFDGYNLLHASRLGEPEQLVDMLASFLAATGAHGVVVFDGLGEDVGRGPLSVRYSADADALLERLAADQRELEQVVLVTSDAAVLATAGQEVVRLPSETFLRELRPAGRRDDAPGGLADKLDEETRDRLERLRRGE